MEVNLPDEETIFKFYKFEFEGIEQPVVIEAYNNEQARALLKDALRLMPQEYGLSKVIDERVVTPVEGVSQRRGDGLVYIWAGKHRTPTGWMEEKQYLESIKPKSE